MLKRLVVCEDEYLLQILKVFIYPPALLLSGEFSGEINSRSTLGVETYTKSLEH